MYTGQGGLSVEEGSSLLATLPVAAGRFWLVCAKGALWVFAGIAASSSLMRALQCPPSLQRPFSCRNGFPL